MKRHFLLVISLSIFLLAELVPLNKPSSRKNFLNDKKKPIEIQAQTRNSSRSIVDFVLSVNGTEMILQKNTQVPRETIVISTKIPAIAFKFPRDPEYEICDKEGSFNVELRRGTENLFRFLCLTPSFFSGNSSSFAITRLRPDQLLTKTSVNDVSNVFSRPSPLTDDRIRQILKDRGITPALIEFVQNEAKRYHE